MMKPLKTDEACDEAQCGTQRGMSLGKPKQVGTARLSNPVSITYGEPDSIGQHEWHAIFALLAEERRARLFRMALHITRNHADAEDVVQESLLKAFTHLDRFRGESRMDTWLYSITSNTARDRIRRLRAYTQVSLEQPFPSEGEAVRLSFPYPGKSPGDACQYAELKEILLIELSRLHPSHRVVIQLCDLAGCSYREAANILNLNLSSLKSRLRRGRKILTGRVLQRFQAQQDLHRRASADRVESDQSQQTGWSGGLATINWRNDDQSIKEEVSLEI